MEPNCDQCIGDWTHERNGCLSLPHWQEEVENGYSDTFVDKATGATHWREIWQNHILKCEIPNFLAILEEHLQIYLKRHG